MRASRPSTMFVGCNTGRHFNQRAVALVSPCPNCHGWITWSGFLQIDDMMQIGFSIAMRGMSAFASIMKNAMALCCLPSLRLASKCLAPLTLSVKRGERGLTQFLKNTEALKIRYVSEKELEKLDPGLKSFVDVDTPAELKRVQSIFSDSRKRGVKKG